MLDCVWKPFEGKRRVLAWPPSLTRMSSNKVARMLRLHEELLLNWFEAKGMVSARSVECLNYTGKLTLRKSYGFQTLRGVKIALYHRLGALPEPQFLPRILLRRHVS